MRINLLDPKPPDPIEAVLHRHAYRIGGPNRLRPALRLLVVGAPHSPVPTVLVRKVGPWMYLSTANYKR